MLLLCDRLLLRRYEHSTSQDNRMATEFYLTSFRVTLSRYGPHYLKSTWSIVQFLVHLYWIYILPALLYSSITYT